MCLYPRLIRNPKYKANKKNKGYAPIPPDKRVAYVPIACGKCIECRRAKTREWQVRLNEELKQNKNALFVTLTFSEDSLHELAKETKGENNAMATLAVKRFRERWRKKFKKSIKHWLVTELGQTKTERIHLHGFLFTNKRENIAEIWKYGYIYIGDYVNEKTINYCVKYVNKIDTKHKNYQPIILTSPGIGRNYENTLSFKESKFKGEETKDYYKLPNGAKISLPIYYRNKLYNEEEREKLWLIKLDKQVRYVNKQKIDTSTDEGIGLYLRILKKQQELNKKLGYFDDSKEWKESEYNLKLKDIQNMTNRQMNTTNRQKKNLET